MAPRLKLQEILETILGTEEVWFQPGAQVTMDYPAIVYNVDGLDTDWADNLAYRQNVEYQVVVIQRDPDDDFWLQVGRLAGASFRRAEVVENLYHYYFNLSF